MTTTFRVVQPRFQGPHREPRRPPGGFLHRFFRRGIGRPLHAFADWLDDWHVTRLFNALTSFAILLAVATFSIDMIDRTEERTIRAWSVVTSPAPGNSGKIAALEYLNSEDWLFKRREPLIGIDLSANSYSTGVYLTGVQLLDANLARARLRNAQLEMSNLRGANLAEADLSAALLTESSLRGAFMRGITLIDAKLALSDLSGALLNSANLEGAGMYRADLSNTTSISANFSGAELRGVKLRYATLQSANLSGANLIDADLSDADLRMAKVRGADLWGASLRRASLHSADFEGADLRFADLTEATGLKAEQLEVACLDETTKLPFLFDVALSRPCPKRKDFGVGAVRG